MSFEYKNEEERQTNESSQQVEFTQQVIPVFPLYSYILVACLIAVFVSQLAGDGETAFMFGGENSITFGGFDKELFRNGEYWRILTGATIHGGILHLGFNSYALFIFGRLIEVLSNRAHLAIVFVLSVIGGGILSLIFLPYGSSIGASGGVVGLLGYMTVYSFKRRNLLPDGFLKNMLINIGFIAIFGLFLMGRIDNFGHLGGLIVGAAYGFIQVPADLHKDPRVVGPITEAFGMISLGVFVFTSIFSILLILQYIKL